VKGLIRSATTTATKTLARSQAALSASTPPPLPSLGGAASAAAVAARTRPRPHPHPQSGGLSLAAAALFSANPALYYAWQWYRLRAGAPMLLSELGYNDADVDEEWLISAARGAIEEYQDVSRAESSFMQLWNEFVLRRSAAA